MNMKCQICARAELVHDTRDMPYTYKGETTVIPAVTGDFCPACGEVVLTMAESIRVSALMLEFNKQVNASIVNPEFIANVRKKLNLDQREAAEIFGGRDQCLLTIREREDEATIGTCKTASDT